MSSYPAYRPSGVEWLGDVPEHWEIRPLKALLSKNDSGVWGDDPDEEDVRSTIVLRSTEQTADGGWAIEAPATRMLSPPEKAGALLTVGDLVVTKSSGSEFHIGKASIVTAEVSDLNACFSNFMQRLRCRSGFDPRLVWYLLNSPVGRQQLVFNSNTTTGLANLNGTILGEVVTPVPPIDEQRTIAEYLDRETERIEILVAKKRQLIERLQEYRNALITRNVTRGLPPDAARAAGLDPSRRLKPSGVEWLGEVPEHWKVKPLGSCVSFRGGTTPSKSRDEFWDGDIPWVSPKDMKRALVADSEDHVTGAALAESGSTTLPVPSVLVVVRGMILAHSLPVAITAAPVTINQDMKALVTHRPLSHRFLYWFLVGAARALVSLCDESAHGTRKLETATLAGFLTPLPPHDEQAAIATFLDAQTTRLDGLVRRAVSAIERLKEYRTALVTAAVTGKVDVREPGAADG